jgi:molybdate transport system substrate-binding protein
MDDTHTSTRTSRIACVLAAAAVLLLAIGLAPDVRAQRAPVIAAASNLNFALTEVANEFAREGGTPVELVFGASGTLTRQIQDGAPFEMFLAADEEFPNKLAAAGLTREPGVVYAIGRIVVFAPNGSPLTPDERLEGLKGLLDARQVRRFAIANPAVAPYGRAAEAVLRARGLWDKLAPHLVLGDTISQAAQFATTGNAAGGIVAYSLVLEPGFAKRGAYVLLPDTDHPPLRQRMVLLKRAGPVAERFFRYVQEAAAQAILRRYGFEVPE